MADSAVLREYLVALGFDIDEAGKKKAGDTMANLDKKATNLGKAVVGVATAAQAMVAVFAYQMEKLYYASKRTDSAVGSIQALEYGAKQIGLSGDVMRSSLEAMARSLRSNPGLQGLLESLGVKVTGRDKADVMIDLVTQLQKMPFFVAERYAAMFGIDADTLFMLQQGIDKMKEAQAARKAMAAAAGVDSDAAAKASMEYANALREVWERVGILKDALAIALLPTMREFAGVVNEVLQDLVKVVQKFTTWADLRRRFKEGITGKTGGGVELSEDSKRRLGITGGTPKNQSWWERMKESWSSSPAGPSSAAPPPAQQNQPGATKAPTGGGTDTQAMFAGLERKYGLPAGWLDRVWKKESNRGDPRFMHSKKGAMGHFQFMPDAAKDYGLKDPNNLAESADAAARYFRNMFKKYKGDPAKAAAAYNWGPGNVDRYGLGRAPKETRDYVDTVAGPVIHQNNPITVTGVSDPQQAASLIGDAQARSNEELVRQLKPRAY